MDHAGPAHDRDTPRSSFLQRTRTGIRRRPGREDIVDEVDILTIKLNTSSKSRLHGALSFTRIHTPERRCRVGSGQDIGPTPCPMGLRQCLPDRVRLVEPARPQPPSMERDRNIKCHTRFEPRRQDGGNRAGKASAATVFQFQDNATRDIAIGNRRNYAVKSRRISETRPARQAVMGIHRERTARATPPRQEVQLLPAFLAKPVIGLDDLPTTRTARWQDIIEQGSREWQGK